MKLRAEELHPPMLEDHTKLSQPVKRLSYFLKQCIKGLYTRQQVAATCRSETLQRRITCELEKFVKIFVAATEFCRHNKSHRFSLIWFFATCRSDKIWCRDKDFHKNSPVHTKWFVAATCHLTLLLQLDARPVHMEWSVAATCCNNLSPSVYWP